ncbi:MAG: hypothetical protein GKS00_18610 [Alphaproteobacteria bacterium]|nr:hypothetical protein [Alphaproteobacteria bacterium]
MERGVADQSVEVAFGAEPFIVFIYVERTIETVCRSIIINDFDTAAARTGRQRIRRYDNARGQRRTFVRNVGVLG